jgi:excisionase family DNA binding protein
MQNFFSIDDIADYLRVSRRHVARLRANGQLPKEDFQIGRRLRWKASSILSWAHQTYGVEPPSTGNSLLDVFAFSPEIQNALRAGGLK